MKFFSKIVGTIATVLICLGLVIGAVGLVMGATRDDFWNAAGRVWDDWGTGSLSESYQGVTSLDFDLGMAEVVIEEGDTFSIRASQVRFRLTSRVEDGTWKIDTKGVRYGQWLGGSRGGDRVTITLPRDFVADKLQLEVGMGTLRAGTLGARDRADVKVGMGEVSIDRLSVPRVEVSCGMGAVHLGGVDTQKADLDCGMGSIDMTVRGAEEDYGYTLDVGVGDVVIGTQRYSGLGNKSSHNTDAPGRLDVDCGMGSVTVRFEEAFEKA